MLLSDKKNYNIYNKELLIIIILLEILKNIYKKSIKTQYLYKL